MAQTLSNDSPIMHDKSHWALSGYHLEFDKSSRTKARAEIIIDSARRWVRHHTSREYIVFVKQLCDSALD